MEIKQMRSRLLILLLFIGTPLHAQRLELTKALEGVASRASEKVEIDLDASMLAFASKILSDSNPEEVSAKKIIAGLSGIYVRSFTFAQDTTLSDADLNSIRSQFVSPAGWWPFAVAVSSQGPPKKRRPDSKLVWTTADGQEVNEIWIWRESPDISRKLPENIPAMVVLAMTPRQFTVVNIVGPIRPE